MNRKNKTGRGFTLIELLVVIVIIGILAAIIVPSINGAMNSARNARAMSQITALDGAIKRFYAEHGRMPVPRGKGFDASNDGIYITGESQSDILLVLLNLDDGWGADEQNTKQLVFLDLDPASFAVKTLEEMQVQLEGEWAYKDPWGKPTVKDNENIYGILMDLNMDDKISNTGYGTGIPEEIRAKVGVFSLGKTGVDTKDPPFKTW
jgi:prepilin-type N-terminal cleavage/methylation domain-containing protein